MPVEVHAAISKTENTQPEAGVDRRSLLRGVAVAGAAVVSVFPQTQVVRAELWEEGDAQCRPQIQEVTPVYPLDDALLSDFIKLSEVLTGAKPLDSRLASQYLERYARHAELSPLLPPLIDAYRTIASSGGGDEAIETAIMQTTLRPAAEQLILLWYVSAFFLPATGDPTSRKWVYGTPEQYDHSLLWKVVHAHPPMTRGGPTGYWAKAPA